MARGFRVYDKLEKRMIDNPASESIYLSGNGNLVNVDHPEIYLMDRYVRRDSAGSPDEDGKEIYEGDILLTEKGIRCVVEWSKEKVRYVICYKNIWTAYPNYIHKALFWASVRSVVIGNIYSNPELLK